MSIGHSDASGGPQLAAVGNCGDNHFDVIVIGAGLSGVGAGYRLQTRCPDKRYVILEARAVIGGTWDLFRYPGIRSDSDMYTLGYPFRPWKDPRIIADGHSIRQYVQDTAREFGIDRHIRFHHRVLGADWSSAEARWQVTVQNSESTLQFTCNFLYGCTGYYRYDAGYQPEFPGQSDFQGTFIHPQHWPEDLDYAGKRIVIIGSGATAVTLLPAMSPSAGHVTMLQRSPSYVMSLPAYDPLVKFLRRLLPDRAAHRLVRWKNILLGQGVYQLSRRAPRFTRQLFRSAAIKSLPRGYAVDTHFNPRYEPWDQRLCLVPDADLFRAIRSGRASVVTGEIDTFTSSGIRLKSSEELPADIIVSATGLQMLALGGVRLSIHGTPVDVGHSYIYKGVMLSNVPNFTFCVGYTNASWTLRADLASTYLCRLLNFMQRRNYHTVVPACDPSAFDSRPLLDLSSGYVQRAAGSLPKQSSRSPWLIPQNYLLDVLTMKLGRLNDGILQFTTN